MSRAAILAGTTMAVCALAVAAPAAGAGREAAAVTGDYVPFAPLSATVLHANGSRGVMSIQGGLEIADPGLRALAVKSMPRLRDAWVGVLSAYAAALPQGAPPDADRIGDALQRSAEQVLKRPGVKVLLGTILVN